MTRTTPPRPADIAAIFPALAPLARTATRLHPRPGSPSAHDSSVGGPLLWPTSDPWPHCDGPHAAPAALPACSLADVRLLRQIRAATRGRPGGGATITPEERAVMNRIEAGRPIPSGPVAMLPVAQQYARDVPALRPPGRADLLQALWCPFDHPDHDMPRTVLLWRSSAAATDLLDAPPEPGVVQHEGYVPWPCVVHPEQVTEYPAPMELDDDLRTDIEEWSTGQKAGADPGSAYDGAENAFYDYELSVAPGWKIGGWPPWGFTDPVRQYCPECGTAMEALLTIASTEWDLGTASWIPYEDQAEALHAGSPYPSPEKPTMIAIGDGGNLQIYACPVSPEHPYTQLLQ